MVVRPGANKKPLQKCRGFFKHYFRSPYYSLDIVWTTD